jgi:NAD(P) transhydrogenase
MEQGRLAACDAFGQETTSTPEHFPYGIYAVPEISTVGATEQELQERGTPYEIGVARLRETARGQILGLDHGLLKLLFCAETRRLLGVHILGEGATELVHIGPAAIILGGTLEYFVDNVFNYPTLAEAYKIAALDAWNRMPRRGVVGTGVVGTSTSRGAVPVAAAPAVASPSASAPVSEPGQPPAPVARELRTVGTSPSA